MTSQNWSDQTKMKPFGGTTLEPVLIVHICWFNNHLSLVGSRPQPWPRVRFPCSLRQLLEDLIWWSPRVTWLILDMWFSWLQKGGALQPHALLHLGIGMILWGWRRAWDIQCTPCFPLTNFRAITVPHGSTRYIKYLMYLYHPAQPYASWQMWAMLIGNLTMGHVNSVWCWRLAWKVGRWTL